MDFPIRCEFCGGTFIQESELGVSCPLCLLLFSVVDKGSDAALPKMAGIAEAGTDGRVEAGTVFGRYRILRFIGDGGMGRIYEAEQDDPRRAVALKLIKPGFGSLDLLHRFEKESQALGRLQHPGIAQIYEAGTAETTFGPQPYFAMEFINGQTLRDYAETHQLSTEERLELMALVCDAVHHAHQRGLIHRDLKPGNILVDHAGQPKVLDFGVARIVDRDPETTLQTGVGQLVGTLAYMSPEQAIGDPLELDTRSDVYALGVILYELLAGQLPYTIGKSIPEALHAIREEDPTRLSSINRTCRGDIETIVAKALEKDKARRYVSAAEMATDIERYLKNEPIVARPPSASYQLRKFAMRNSGIVLGIAAVIAALSAAGAATSTWMAVSYNRLAIAAEKDRDRALQAENEALKAHKDAIEATSRANAIQELLEQRLRVAEVSRREKDAVEAELLVAGGTSKLPMLDMHGLNDLRPRRPSRQLKVSQNWQTK